MAVIVKYVNGETVFDYQRDELPEWIKIDEKMGNCRYSYNGEDYIVVYPNNFFEKHDIETDGLF